MLTIFCDRMLFLQYIDTWENGHPQMKLIGRDGADRG